MVLFSALSVFAADFKSGDLWYRITGTNTVEVAQHEDHKSLTGVAIPSSVTNGGVTYSVKRVGSQAFYDCSSLTSVDIPNSVTSIGEDVFSACPSLTSYIL